jgi:hypothetical protein
MFRRGPFRRRPLAPGAPQARLVRQSLGRAHQMMETSNYAGAADIYERLAKGAETRSMPLRAAHLFLQAARARLYASQFEPGIPLLRHGLNMLAQLQRWSALYKNGQMAVSELRRLSQNQAADDLQIWLDAALNSHPEAKTPPSGSAGQMLPPNLPAKCPNCGGSIRPNEIEWLDPHTAECSYCGSPVQSEE